MDVKIALFFIIVALCGYGYHEYTDLQLTIVKGQQQLNDLQAKLDKIELEDKKIQDSKRQWAKSLADAQAQIAGLTKQVQLDQGAIADAKKEALAAEKANQPKPPTAPVFTNNLGTITTQAGTSFLNCRLLNVKSDRIVISYSDGITEIKYIVLPTYLQRKFGYNPNQPAGLTEAQVHSLERLRIAADQAAGN